jgi:hypothetical protein
MIVSNPNLPRQNKATRFERELALCRGLWTEIVALEPETDALEFLACAHRAGYLSDPQRLINKAIAAARLHDRMRA